MSWTAWTRQNSKAHLHDSVKKSRSASLATAARSAACQSYFIVSLVIHTLSSAHIMDLMDASDFKGASARQLHKLMEPLANDGIAVAMVSDFIVLLAIHTLTSAHVMKLMDMSELKAQRRICTTAS